MRKTSCQMYTSGNDVNMSSHIAVIEDNIHLNESHFIISEREWLTLFSIYANITAIVPAEKSWISPSNAHSSFTSK